MFSENFQGTDLHSVAPVPDNWMVKTVLFSTLNNVLLWFGNIERDLDWQISREWEETTLTQMNTETLSRKGRG